MIHSFLNWGGFMHQTLLFPFFFFSQVNPKQINRIVFNLPHLHGGEDLEMISLLLNTPFMTLFKLYISAYGPLVTLTHVLPVTQQSHGSSSVASPVKTLPACFPSLLLFSSSECRLSHRFPWPGNFCEIFDPWRWVKQIKCNSHWLKGYRDLLECRARKPGLHTHWVTVLLEGIPSEAGGLSRPVNYLAKVKRLLHSSEEKCIGEQFLFFSL